MNVTVEEIEKHPHEYLHRVIEGETLVLFHDEQPVAEIRPLTADSELRPFGLAKGEFVIPDDFDAPLPDDVVDQFEGR
jgi:antitoxin (DNA-binding transcriptional repressor) of toxin-antitoxin stability system